MSTTSMSDLSTLFESGRVSWGLRGDPYLWKEMKPHFKGFPIPHQEEEMRKVVGKVFLEITGHDFNETQHFYVDRYSREKRGISYQWVDL